MVTVQHVPGYAAPTANATATGLGVSVTTLVLWVLMVVCVSFILRWCYHWLRAWFGQFHIESSGSSRRNGSSKHKKRRSKYSDSDDDDQDDDSSSSGDDRGNGSPRGRRGHRRGQSRSGGKRRR